MIAEHLTLPDPAVREALLGGRGLRPLQETVIEHIREGRNVLAVFGTGQGKSVCFQIPAIEAVIQRGAKTIICYPLRSLANDQYEALSRGLEGLPVRLYRANGSITAKERAALDAALEDGSWDILIATPEFVAYHLERLTQEHNKTDLLVMDEAHHLLESRHRSAYRKFRQTVTALAPRQTAAFTATARKDTFEHIMKTLDTQAWVINPAIRENLRIVDARNESAKDAYILRVARAAAGKMIIYCNSRKVTTALAEDLEAKGVVGGVACYNAEMGTKKRREVEDDFRAGRIRVVVATSAFGEGIDLPDVRDVVLYHLNFDMVSFNQMAGRAGRDGAEACVHLVYGEEDRKLNDFIMQKGSPSVPLLRKIYADLRRRANGEELRGTYADFDRMLRSREYDAATISTALKIFVEVGLATVENDTESRGKVVNLLTPPENLDITASERYEEGQATIEAFNAFCQLAMKESAGELQARISKPIYPNDIELQGSVEGEAEANPILDW